MVLEQIVWVKKIFVSFLTIKFLHTLQATKLERRCWEVPAQRSDLRRCGKALEPNWISTSSLSTLKK